MIPAAWPSSSSPLVNPTLFVAIKFIANIALHNFFFFILLKYYVIIILLPIYDF